MHRNLWDLIAQGKFQWFRIDPSRKDREDFIAALKSFIDTWGCAEFRDDTYSSFRVFERPDKVKEELERINVREGYFPLTGATFSSKIGKDTAKGLSSPYGAKNTSNSYGDFYTKAYEPETLEKQLKRDADLAAKAIPIPGVNTEDDEDEF